MKEELFILKVTPSTNKTVYKDRIISALYITGILQYKIEGICFRNHINKDTKFYEDAISETFLCLCQKPADEIIEMYEDNPARLIGLGVKIAVLKCVTKNSNSPEYPKHSLMTQIFHTSTLRQKEHVSPTGEEEYPNDFSQILADKEPEEDTLSPVWELILDKLNTMELETLNECLQGKKGAGRYTNDFKLRRLNLHDKIREIVGNIDDNTTTEI